jgi:hypothetical protein
MAFVDLVVVSMAAATAAMLIKNRFQSVSFVRSRVDGREYLVLMRNDAEDMRGAADVLAELHARVLRLLDAMPPGDRRTRRLRERYDREAVSEGGEGEGYTSFSVQKRKIVLCLREKVDGRLGRLEDVNTVAYVMLHELAHLATEGYGHTPTFWRNFKFVLRVAQRAGLYERIDYAQRPARYCGITISSTSLK